MAPSSGLINLLELLTELRKKSFTSRIRVYYKRIELWNSRWRRCAGRGVGGHGAPMSSPGVLSPRISSQKVSKFYALGFYGDFLSQSQWIKSLVLMIDSVSSPSPFPGGWKGEVGVG